ncbi:MAG TPA: FecR domain-containing protein [Vitreimonas sp.]|uniref:FecR family protein n=1 Tax=Vitreimonas sp. TaxID=3069702 RepID=UPI002D220279|nr:FecR domain-containing protein [Vitreimonas sp.]HYD86050.1 FecR domain-containing protein [Vitreimonas sp.]
MSGPISPTVIRAANEWLVRLRDENVTGDDHAAFDAWLNTDPCHGAAFARVTEQVSDIGALGPALHAYLSERPARPHSRNRRTIASVSLAAAALIAIGWFSVRTLSPPVYATAIGEQRAIELADGSTIELNTNSRIVVRFEEDVRYLELTRGEAVFDVAHDPTRPFIVEAGDNRVRAVGTQFAVRLAGEEMSVLVTEGVVSVAGEIESAAVASARENAATRLVAGQRLDVADGAAAVAVLPVAEIERNLTWRSGMLQFDGQSLADAVEEVSRYTGARFTLTDSDVRELRVWAYFRASDLDGFLTNLELNNPSLEIRREAGTVHISRRPA